MVYVPPDYPGAIPDYAEIWPYVDNVDDVVVADWDALVKELRAALAELGTNPKGAKADVKTRLDDVDTAVGTNTTHKDGDGSDHADVATNTAAKHAQGSDTALGAQVENLDMNTHKIVGVVDPTANQEAATKKYVDDQAPGGGTYVDRGDPADWDWKAPNLTSDAAWHDLDISAVVPAGAKAVLFLGNVLFNGVGGFLAIRKNGNAQWMNMDYLQTLIANVNSQFNMIVECDGNRVIEYYLSNVAWDNYGLCVRGWWT